MPAWRPFGSPQHPRECAAADLVALPTGMHSGTFSQRWLGARLLHRANSLTSRKSSASFVSRGSEMGPEWQQSVNDVFVDERQSVLRSIDTSAAPTYWKLGSSNSRPQVMPRSPSPRIVFPQNVSALWSIAQWLLAANVNNDRRFLPGHVCP